MNKTPRMNRLGRNKKGEQSRRNKVKELNNIIIIQNICNNHGKRCAKEKEESKTFALPLKSYLGVFPRICLDEDVTAITDGLDTVDGL